MRCHWVSGLVAACLGAATWWPGQAHACECAPDAFAVADPKPEAQDVARNHAVVVIGFFDPKTLELTAADGTAVPFELEAGPSSGCVGTMYAELIPKGDGFAANSSYRVRAVPSHPRSARHELTFTTGDWYWPEPEDYPPLEAKVSLMTGYPESGGCGTGNIISCTTLNYFKDVELIARKDGEIILRWVLQSNDPNFRFKVVPDCIEFRRREPSGARITPLELCGDALNVSPFVDSEAGDRDFLCRDGLVGVGPRARPSAPDVASKAADAGEDQSAAAPGDRVAADARPSDSGCTAVPAARTTSGRASFFVVLMGLLLAGRRRSGRLTRGLGLAAPPSAASTRHCD